MTLNDLKKKYGIGAQAAETKPKSTGLDQLRKKYGISSTTDIVEEAKAKPRLYKNEAEYYAANARPYDEVKAELDAVTKRRNTYDNEKAMRSEGLTGKVWQKRYGDSNTARIEELARLIEEENKRIAALTDEAKRSQSGKYSSLAENEDFESGSAYDKNTKATVKNQLYRQINNPDLPLMNEEYTDTPREITKQMTEDEVKTYNYLYNTQGEDAAQEYFDYLKDELNKRRGGEIAGNIKTDVGRAAYAGIAAVDNTTTGIKQLFKEEAVKPTVAQYASAEAAEDVETKVGKFAYDLSATVGNMAPSILASAVLGKVAGEAVMGAATAGNTYTEAINSGMTPRQAMKYGVLVGASEIVTGSLLGGISALGLNPLGNAAGKLVSGSKFAKLLGATDNAFIKAAAKMAGSMAGEVAEEEAQLFLEPLFKKMATGEEYDAPEWEEIVYTALLSAASAGLFEAPGNIAEAVQESRQKKAEKIINDAIETVKTEQTAAAQTETAQNEVLAENEAQTSNDTAEEKAAEVKRKDAYSEMVQNYADSMDAAGQNVFIEAYDGSVEPDVYVKEMQDAYDAGRRGEELAASETAIGDDRRQLAYKAGIADKATADADYGFVHNEVSHTVDRKLVQNLNRIGKDLKVKIQFVDSVRGDTANGSYRNGVITISRKAENPYMVVAKHEITHHLKQTAAKSYGAYEAYAVETFAKSLGLSADALVQDRIAEAARSGDRLTAEQAREEIAADFTEMIFTDEKTLRRFVETHSKSLDGRNMLQRLFDAIRRFIARLGKMDESVLPGMGITREQLEKAERLYREVLAEGAQQRGTAVTTAKAENGKAMMSLAKNFDAEFNKAIANTDYYKNNVFVLGKLPKLYSAFGLDASLDLTITSKHLRNAILPKDPKKHQHGLSKAKIKAAILQLDTPAIVMFNEQGVMYAVVTETDSENIPITFCIEPNGNVYISNTEIKSNHALSIYGRDNTYNFIETKAKNNNVLLVNKKETTLIEQILGKQFSNNLYNSGFNSNVARFKRIVKDKQYLDAVKRGDMETAQKMVDEAAKAAGYDKLFYHGAKKGGGFTVFRDWQYFTENKRYAARYADRNSDKSLYTTYVKLEKPFDTRKAADRKLFNAIRQEYGLTEIQESGLPDWTDGYDISDYIDENDLDYDGIILDEGGDMVNGKPVSRGASYVVRKSAQIKSADPVTYDDNGNVIPLSERFNPKHSDIRYSTKGGGLDALRKQYGEIEPGENPVRQAHVPRKTEKHKNVSQLMRTIIEAGATPDVVLPDIDQIIADGDVSREAYGDDAAIDKAKNKLNYDGWDKTISAWYESVKKGEVSKDLTTMGWVLYNNAVNDAKAETDVKKRKAKIKSSLDIIMAMVGHQRNAAQALQATRILKKLAPEAQLYGVMQSVRSLQDELEKKFKDKAPNLKIDQVLAERLLTATSEKARDEALHDIYRDIGRQMPSTFLDKWNAWRYLAMLGNVRTHGRNIVGNAAFVPLVGVKNAVATGLEKAVYTFGGHKLQRTKGIPTKELLAAAYKDYSKLTDKERAGEKYNDNANANMWIEEGRQIWGHKTKFGKGVEALRKYNSERLEKEDEWFVKPHYALALAQYCKANGITAQMIAEGKGLDDARRYAIKEAQKATYRDANDVSEFVGSLGKYKGDNVALKAGSLFVDAVLPFRKTPANILVRAVEYSPVGLIKSISIDLVRMKQDKISGAQVIDNLAAGLTGTALMGLGVLLSKLGLVIGMGSDDEDERKFNELQGYQGYAIVFDDRTYTVDWLAPEAMPFFVGVNLAELKAFEEADISAIQSALTNITAPMLEMSCLQGLNDMIEAAGSVQGKGVSAMMQMVSNAATSYLTQALPTLFGQVERVTESTRQQTYADKGNKVLTPNMQYTLGKVLNKTLNPFDDVGQIPYIDAWGRETSTGNVGVRAFNNLLNPGYSAKIRTSEMEKELQRLFDETGEKSVLPDRAAKYITVEGEKIDLNKNQYVKYATVKGQTAYDMLTKITASAQYKALDKQSKVDLISKVYSYANAIAKAEVTKTQKDKALRYQPDGWIKKAADTSKATGIPAWKYVLIYNGQTDIKGLTDKDGDTISLSSSLLMMEYLYGFIGLSDAQRQALYADFGVAKSVRHYDRQRVAQELKKMRAKAGK